MELRKRTIDDDATFINLVGQVKDLSIEEIGQYANQIQGTIGSNPVVIYFDFLAQQGYMEVKAAP
ncbi:MAG TPA: hypothetical protein VJ576_17080 [Rhodocyclaceae bacterium]|nr:hypothetical protein [Rhodocyclaceae bacterium]